MKSTDILKATLGQEQQESNNKSNSESLKQDEQNGKQIGGTPLVSRKTDRGWIVTCGQYPISRHTFETYDELVEHVNGMTIGWAEIGLITAAHTDYLSARITELENLINKK